MTTVVAIEQGRVERVTERVSRGRVRFVESVGEAGDVGEHGGGTAAATAQGARSAIDVLRVERGEREAGEGVRVWRHAGAGERAFGCGWYRHVMLRLLHQHLFILLDRLYHLTHGDISVLGPTLKTVDVAAVLVLHVGTLLAKSGTLLFPSLLSGKAFSIGGNETVVLLVEPQLTLLKTFPLLQGSGHIGLHALNLALDSSLDVVKLASNGVFVVALLFPRGLLGCSFCGVFLRNVTEVVGLKGIFSSSVVGLANVLSELEDSLALAFITTSSVGKAIAQIVDLLSDGTDGGLVILLVPLQTVP